MTRERRTQDLIALDLVRHIRKAYRGKFPTQPKPSPEWWAKLRDLAEALDRHSNHLDQLETPCTSTTTTNPPRDLMPTGQKDLAQIQENIAYWTAKASPKTAAPPAPQDRPAPAPAAEERPAPPSALRLALTWPWRKLAQRSKP